MTESNTNHLSFNDLNLPKPILDVLNKINITRPTPIQQAAIPATLAGQDLIGCAQTGTGKTLAFLLPILTKLIQNPSQTALILVPTRELAFQISDVLKSLALPTTRINCASLIGGSSMGAQLRSLHQRPQIIVATPGRMIDHMGRKSVNLSTVNTVVLDEADRMLDMGFEKQISRILSTVPKTRQTMLFSATMSDQVRQIANKYMRTPKFIDVKKEASTPHKIKHSVVQTSRQTKKEILLDHLNAKSGSVLIFVNTKHGTDRLTNYLMDYGYPVARIHGGRTQGQRNQAILGFRSKQYRILVATDVAARGIDIPHIEHVINFELPKDTDDYIHRIGRTARAGAAGEALALIAEDELKLWNRISKIYKIGQIIGSPEKSHNKPFKGNRPNNRFNKKKNKFKSKSNHSRY